MVEKAFIEALRNRKRNQSMLRYQVNSSTETRTLIFVTQLALAFHVLSAIITT